MFKIKYIYFLGIFFLSFNTQFLLAQGNVDKKNEFSKLDSKFVPNNITDDKQVEYVLRAYPINSNGISNLKMVSFLEIEVLNSEIDIKNIEEVDYHSEVVIKTIRKQTYAQIFTNKYRKLNGKVMELKSCDFEFITNPSAAQYKVTGNRTYVAQSTLNTGNWIKVSVNSDNIYKVDYNFLNTHFNLSNASIPTQKIQVFGNGGTPIPSNNITPRFDDIQEIPLYINDGGDGSFGLGDYLLFFATGPDEISWQDSSFFEHEKNIYSDFSYYFINIDGQNGKRIPTASGMQETQISNEFYSHIYHEKDSVNIGGIGKYWWGEMNFYAANLTTNFSHTISDIDFTKKINVKILYAVEAEVGGNILTWSLNNQQSTIQKSYSYVSNTDYSAYYLSGILKDSFSVNSNTLSLKLNFSPAAYSSKGFLGYYDLTIPRLLNASISEPTIISNPKLIRKNSKTKFVFSGVNSNLKVWDIQNIHQVSNLPTSIQNNATSVINNTDSACRLVAFEEQQITNSPEFVGKVENQNLHSLSNIDFIILTNKLFWNQAQELANYRSANDGITVKVIDIEQVYNEFSSGGQDFFALRDFVKMLYDKANTLSEQPKYVLLLGDASYDYKNRLADNTNYVPSCIHDQLSISRLDIFCSDDYIAILDDNENPLDDYSIAGLDLGVGRFICKNTNEAQIIVNKIINYESSYSFGNWKSNICFVADNVDESISNFHMTDAEEVNQQLISVNNLLNTDKIYADAYPLNSTPGGATIPDVNAKINLAMNQGVLFWNYNGHGGLDNLAQESILTIGDINSWQNKSKLPIMVTSTCDFSRFDDPKLKSAGERIFSNSENGAVALFTTTQLVFQGQNKSLNKAFVNEEFKIDNQGYLSRLGDGWMNAKNTNYGPGYRINTQKFVLLGDPSMRPAFPNHRVVIDSIIQLNDSKKTDTLKALGRYTIFGHVQTVTGQKINGFNGLFYGTIFDKEKTYTTYPQYSNIPVRSYNLANNIIFKGKANIINGEFSCPFILPKDINYSFARGQISLYANTTEIDAIGKDYNFIVGGAFPGIVADNQGPIIKGFMNDTLFVDGGITNPDPVLLLKLIDESGINISGSNPGHDLVGSLDNAISQPIVLNSFYEGDINSYNSGWVKYPLKGIAPGKHFIDIKAWDGSNNSSNLRINFEVKGQEDLVLAHVYNYPNPFSTHTEFMFEHNFPNQELIISIKIKTITGKVVKNINRNIFAFGTRIDGIEWDGKDDFGDKLGIGVYYYDLKVTRQDGKSSSKLEKLYIIH